MNATRLALVPALKHEERFFAIKRLTARGVLMTGQVAISTVLLVTALLFVRNLTRSQVTNPGFEVDRALMADIGFVRGRAGADPVGFLQSAADRVRGMPGIEAAAYTAHIPLTAKGGSSNGLTARIGTATDRQHVEFAKVIVGPGFFSTLRIRMIAGRDFQTTDAPGTPTVAIINQEFARKYFRGESPIGQRLQFLEEKLDFLIVGVVANAKHITLGEEQCPALFLPLRQHAKNIETAFVVARTRGEPTPLVLPVREALGEMDRSNSVVVEPMTSVLTFALLPSRIGAAVLGTLGVLGLLLAAFGLYAIVSYNVSRRVAEIAIRSALGASKGAILRLVVRDVSLQVGVGLLIGLGTSALVTAPLGTFLAAGLSTTDPMSFAGTAVVFLLVAVLAACLPARSATRVSPVVAMRLD